MTALAKHCHVYIIIGYRLTSCLNSNSLPAYTDVKHSTEKRRVFVFLFCFCFVYFDLPSLVLRTILEGNCVKQNCWQ